MAEPNMYETPRAPSALRTVRVILYIQGGGTLLLLVLLGAAISSANEHGQEVAGYVLPLMVLSVIAAVAAFVCAATIVKQDRPWVRPTVFVIEGVTALFGLINLASGEGAGIGQLAIPVLVISLLMRRDVRDWLDGRDHRNVGGAP